MTKKEQQLFHSHPDYQRISGEKQRVQNINVGVDRPDYIPYAKAMRLLAERIGATPEEMAAWIFYGPELGGLRAYEHAHEFADPWVFSYAVRTHPRISEDYVSPLMNLWFLKEEIINFYPSERYITGKKLIEEWSKQPGIEPKVYIMAKIRESRLTGFHPICGITGAGCSLLGVDPRIETAFFPVSEIEEIETLDFGNDECNRESEHKQPGHLNHDLKMQKRANEIAAELKKKTPGRVSTRDEVAKKLAAELGMTSETVLRRIRKQWK
ncbi:hypothetical protein SAMN05216404_108121 [Nitrosospira multiformis]|uniref:Uncharacterized protein n=1 Tax=Nitrosospira multiformis TaxID=1231 RepID=A0A1H8KEF8_9PROT|nr:AsnC family protein [Nitrosospira multiformis]SEN91389.1 hypothetical protein SAMN05216404_108121 [Nitrosospira multiformis]